MSFHGSHNEKCSCAPDTVDEFTNQQKLLLLFITEHTKSITVDVIHRCQTNETKLLVMTHPEIRWWRVLCRFRHAENCIVDTTYAVCKLSPKGWLALDVVEGEGDTYDYDRWHVWSRGGGGQLTVTRQMVYQTAVRLQTSDTLPLDPPDCDNAVHGRPTCNHLHDSFSLSCYRTTAHPRACSTDSLSSTK